MIRVKEIDRYLDRDYFIKILKQLIRVPTQVPLGAETFMEPDDPRLVEYVQGVLRPIMEDAEIHDIVDMPLNQLVVRMGRGTRPESLLIQAYTPTQHNNLMRDPFVPRIGHAPEDGVHEPCIFGQGVSQNKVHQAAMITVLKALVWSGMELGGTLYFAINNEGRSSHQCSEAIIPRLDPKPDSALILIGTGMDISVGNRGRVDINVHVRGRASHSSTPDKSHNVIEAASEVIRRLGSMRFEKNHPQLGGQHAVVYQVVYSPLAPHTIPDYARLRVDRRLLPGDDIDRAVEEVRGAIGDLSPFQVEVERGVHMLPSLVDENSSIVRDLSEANFTARGVRPRLNYGPGAFDAGFSSTTMRIPTVMWGASGGDRLLGDDYVSLRDAWAEVCTLSRLIMTLG